jgi:hypothetical protein
MGSRTAPISGDAANVVMEASVWNVGFERRSVGLAVPSLPEGLNPFAWNVSRSLELGWRRASL